MSAEARLIAIDWGSTQLRAWLLGTGGVPLAERSSDDGASCITGGAAAFDGALHALAGDWLAQGHASIACGMVGSAHGWREAPYVACPTNLGCLHEHLLQVHTAAGNTVHIVPGLIHQAMGGTPDVMRGEETQVVGLLAKQVTLQTSGTVLMPGTHSKWVRLEQGSVVGLRTCMTGELYAVMRQHSVLGRLLPRVDGLFDVEAFDTGVSAARRGDGRDLGGQLFAVRTLGLTGRMGPAALPDYLSGLLIGHELVAGLRQDIGKLTLIGEPALCQRYLHALQALYAFDVAVPAVHTNTARLGLWQIAKQAGLV